MPGNPEARRVNREPRVQSQEPDLRAAEPLGPITRVGKLGNPLFGQPQQHFAKRFDSLADVRFLWPGAHHRLLQTLVLFQHGFQLSRQTLPVIGGDGRRPRGRGRSLARVRQYLRLQFTHSNRLVGDHADKDHDHTTHCNAARAHVSDREAARRRTMHKCNPRDANLELQRRQITPAAPRRTARGARVGFAVVSRLVAHTGEDKPPSDRAPALLFARCLRRAAGRPRE